MKTGLWKNKLINKLLGGGLIIMSTLILSACSTTSLKSLSKGPINFESKFTVVAETNCNEVSYGGSRLTDSSKHIEQALTDYGFKVVQGGHADFLFHFMCRSESDLNLEVIPNEISAMLMVASITLIPTYWPTDLWVDMEVYDLRGYEPESVGLFASSYVSQERIIWAPFILFKLAYDFGIDKYKYEKFYEGIRLSTQSLIHDAESKEIFD
tara:strand:+ start:30908 stop:31540 length:633 start_codon:yes stop_codon:yes gene_type:complete